MNMETQIFLIEDQKELIYDNEQLTEFQSLVGELGLKCVNKIDSDKSPIPYMWLDESTVRAFKILCPSVDKVESYTLEIPLEVLRQVKLSKVEKYFDWIEVWSNRSNPDPFMIGYVYSSDENRKQGYTWNAIPYLIARWGAEKKSVEELIEMAVSKATNSVKDYSQAAIAKMTSWNQCPEAWAREYVFRNNSEVSRIIQFGGDTLPF